MVKRPDNEDIIIAFEQQTKFRSRVGMLQYLVKHSRFDIANSVTKLSKVADGTTTGNRNWKLEFVAKMYKLIITTDYIVLNLKPNEKRPSLEMEGLPEKDGQSELE
jgi:hypothetical protein